MSDFNFCVLTSYKDLEINGCLTQLSWLSRLSGCLIRNTQFTDLRWHLRSFLQHFCRKVMQVSQCYFFYNLLQDLIIIKQGTLKHGGYSLKRYISLKVKSRNHFNFYIKSCKLIDIAHILSMNNVDVYKHV